ncbi:putative oxidoreductase [Corynebacterium ciconiae DSM 44920]|uniref:aldo/keto reductase n=1 Tax=Corynebacterium ciconiae TaxID=227319 RepID=UPI0003664A22|nr:aldo/keto reductase [Corynebacterium ciconiae]WKD61702.1 putative oxidoreductase [Corynebacterium ciconiae DSM 44920]
MSSFVPSITLNDSTPIPQLGLGLWKIDPADCETVIRTAIDAGYRHFDCAAIYKNEEAVGAALRAAIAAGDVDRDEIFVVSKVWNNQQGFEETGEAFNQSLTRLGLDYLDMYMVHWPCADKGTYQSTFEAIAQLQGLGRVQTVGVCNFYEETLDSIIADTGITPAINQIELHPGLSQQQLVDYHHHHGIVTECWSPLGQGEILGHPVLGEIAEEHGVTPAQVALRWSLQHDRIVIPRSRTPERIRENIDVFSFELTEEELDRITAMDQADGAGRVGLDPREFS